MSQLREFLSGYTGNALLIVAVILLMKFGPRALSAFKFYKGVQKEFADSQTQKLATLKEERDNALKALEEVERDLRQVKRDLERREDFGRQDRAHIRLLKVRIKELKGDFDDIDEQILNFFASESSPRHNVQ